MPGPSNKRKKQKKGKEKSRKAKEVVEAEVEVKGEEYRPIGLGSPIARKVEEAMFERPFIYDPGNGPRVRDVKMFLKSSFAQPIAPDDELCQEFGQKEVLEMLMTVLPEEAALILWYNKSRKKSRICPACLRLYNIGELLADISKSSLMGEESAGGEEKISVSAQLLREQELSGFCSLLCFGIAGLGFSDAIRGAWGCKVEEMKEESWAGLKNIMVGGSEVGTVLGMIVKMTRMDDLGLLELCFE